MRNLAERHLNLATWVVLAAGMEAILVWSARAQAFTARQWWWLSVATVVLAGLCAWIISWEADDPDPDDPEPDDPESGDPVTDDPDSGDPGAGEPQPGGPERTEPQAGGDASSP